LAIPEDFSVVTPPAYARPFPRKPSVRALVHHFPPWIEDVFPAIPLLFKQNRYDSCPFFGVMPGFLVRFPASAWLYLLVNDFVTPERKSFEHPQTLRSRPVEAENT